MIVTYKANGFFLVHGLWLRESGLALLYGVGYKYYLN